MQKSIPNHLSKFLFLLPVLLISTVLAATGPAGEKPIWLVVTKPMFTEAVKPLRQKRIKDGFKTIISTQPVAKAITSLKHRPSFILLVGDDQPGQEDKRWYVPGQRRKLYRWRAPQKKEFASDSLWGDFDCDLVPDIPVGRIPARTTEQLKLVVDKIIAFEDRAPTLDDLRMPIWAGSSGYNQMFNNMATILLLTTIEKHASPWSRPWIISSDAAHSLCGWPPNQAAIFTQQLKRGGSMVTMMGHGGEKYFYAMSFNDTGIGYAAAHAEKALAAGKPGPPLVIIACSTGNFTSNENCLTEALLFMPGGPVATIGATTESHPLPNYFSGLCLLQQRGLNEKRLGNIWLATQLNAMKARDFFIERMLVDVEGKLEDKMNVINLRRDQVLMYALLGDPAMRMHLPDKLQVKIKRLDDGWHWDAQKPKGASKLFVSFRPGGQSFPPVTGQLEKVSATKLFEQANATFAFTPIGELTAEQIWKGKINKEKGTLRLVAIAPNHLYVAAFELEVPRD